MPTKDIMMYVSFPYVWCDRITVSKLAVFIDRGDMCAEKTYIYFFIILKQEHSKEVVYFQEMTVFA